VKNLIPADPVYRKAERTDCRNTQAVPFYQANAECYCTKMYLHVTFEVLTAVKMKIKVFWGKAPCSLVDRNQCCGGTCLLHLQGWRQHVPLQHTTCHHILEGCYLNYFFSKV